MGSERETLVLERMTQAGRRRGPHTASMRLLLAAALAALCAVGAQARPGTPGAVGPGGGMDAYPRVESAAEALGRALGAPLDAETVRGIAERIEFADRHAVHQAAGKEQLWMVCALAQGGIMGGLAGLACHDLTRGETYLVGGPGLIMTGAGAGAGLLLGERPAGASFEGRFFCPSGGAAVMWLGFETFVCAEEGMARSAWFLGWQVGFYGALGGKWLTFTRVG